MSKEDIEEIRSRISIKYPDISIGRLPRKTFDFFTKLAREEFCNDYGMTLRKLVEDSIELEKIKKLLYSSKLDITISLKNEEQDKD